MSNKRARDNAPADDIIGIETTDGKVCYFHRSTLVNAGGYFAARFGNGRIPPGSERRDEIGRSIYFVERDGELFGKYIRPYILTNKPGDLLYLHLTRHQESGGRCAMRQVLMRSMGFPSY